MINYDILIDMKKSGCIDTGYELSQGDKELVEFNVILKNGSANYTPEGDSTIVFKKANNTTESGALIPDGNKFNYKIKGSELSVPGPVLAEIKTYDSETGRASSSRFKFWVKTDLANYDTTETGTYIGELEHKIIEANALIDQLTQSRDEALVMIEELGVGNFVNVDKIVNTTAVTEAGFVPDALLVKDNALAIDTLTNNLGSLGMSSKKHSIAGSILSLTLEVPENTMAFIATQTETTDLPDTTSKWLYATGLVLRRGWDVKLILYAYESADVAYNYYRNTTKTWTGWTVK